MNLLRIFDLNKQIKEKEELLDALTKRYNETKENLDNLSKTELKIGDLVIISYLNATHIGEVVSDPTITKSGFFNMLDVEIIIRVDGKDISVPIRLVSKINNYKPQS